ncbi:snRNA-activating protein complex subunit 1-like [Actinia tenebrosa]|uniref:snRNA-activating protein complex subunit 1-like n=1 Tax=Actinia tenebrosa TaxID=6105 RepID=A0A6P8I9D6_ACTTE|nr:snRNA-activating protein complex subunit 1-like [Actinia tenebrosa]
MAEGLVEDCRLLLSRFESRGTVRFEVFSELWREMNFSLIHCGRKDANGRIQITEYLYRIILSYLSPSCTFIYRVGAIYALYGVYSTQLCNPKIKIRMTILTWNNLKDLHEELIYLKHHDADFILRSLKNSKAFLFCALPTQIAYGSRDGITSREGEHTAAIALEADQVIDKTCGMLERIHKIHNKYQNTRERLFSFEDTSLSKSALDVVHTGLAVDIARDIETFDKWKQNRCLKHVLNQRKSTILMIPDDNFEKNRPRVSAMDNLTQNTLTESATRAKLLEQIKKRSFSQVGKVSRSMRHLKPTAAEDDSTNTKRQKDDK